LREIFCAKIIWSDGDRQTRAQISNKMPFKRL
jgi:hypothetical protein